MFAVEQIDSTKLDFELVNFVRCPLIEVSERVTHNKNDLGIPTVRQVYRCPLRKFFVSLIDLWVILVSQREWSR